MPKKELEHICKNCKLYNMEDRYCRVVVLFEGERINPPTEPNTMCIFEETGVAEDIQQVKWWTEDPDTGEKSKNGVVKIEYPVGFFGKED
jgi:hypothetical protein